MSSTPRRRAHPRDYAVSPEDELGRYVPVEEPVYDSHGNLIDEAYVERAVEEVHRALGRPSLSEAGGSSPTVSFRLPADKRELAERTAQQEGKTVSELAREALEYYLAQRPGA